MTGDITESLVEATLRQLGEPETHDLVNAISKKFATYSKGAIKKKVIKCLKSLRKEGKVTKTRRRVERKRNGSKWVVEADVWVPLGIPRTETLPPIGWNGYYKIPDEKLVVEAASKALSEWCKETYEIPTGVRVNEGISLAEDLSGKLTLSMRTENVNGILKVRVGSASLPSFNSLSPATYIAKLVFHLHGGSFQSGPGAPKARVIQVFPDGNEIDIGMDSFAPTWVVSLNAWPDDSSFSLLYHYERLYRSDSLLERLLEDVLIESIRKLCRKYGVQYSVKWFQTWLHPKVEENSVHAVGTEELTCAVKNLLSAKRDADLFLNKFKKRLAGALIANELSVGKNEE